MCNDELEGVFQEKDEIRKNGSKTGYSFTAVRLTTGFDNQVIILRVYQSSGGYHRNLSTVSLFRIVIFSFLRENPAVSVPICRRY